MSFEAITNISQAENAAKVAVSYMEAQARQMLTDAENNGKAAVAQAIERAENEIAELRKQAAEKSKHEADDLSSTVENRKAGLRAIAESRLSEAANLVVERIVKG